MIKIRPHHLLCMRAYIGNGYSEEFKIEMEKVINSMPTGEKIKASEVLEINSNHKIADKLKELYKDNKEEFEKYTKVIYFEARLIEGLPIDNPTEMSNLMCDIMADK